VGSGSWDQMGPPEGIREGRGGILPAPSGGGSGSRSGNRSEASLSELEGARHLRECGAEDEASSRPLGSAAEHRDEAAPCWP